jgi:hypothetical protein
MPVDPMKQERLDEVKAMLDAFAKKHLASAPEIAGYVNKLWDQVGRKRTYIITGGSAAVWAAAVIYVIARLNFLFDKSNENYLPPDVICDFFGVRKGTASTRATEIAHACKIHIGQEGLCSQDISDGLNYVQLSNGLIVTRRMAREMRLL